VSERHSPTRAMTSGSHKESGQLISHSLLLFRDLVDSPRDLMERSVSSLTLRIGFRTWDFLALGPILLSKRWIIIDREATEVGCLLPKNKGGRLTLG
jgi:hypothetical protein